MKNLILFTTLFTLLMTENTFAQGVWGDKLRIGGTTSLLGEFKRTEPNGKDAVVKIRGARSGNVDARIASLQLSNYDSNENGGTDYILGIISGGMADATGRTGYLRFDTNEGGQLRERMRIKSTGEIGIGTPTPAQKLHVQGVVRSSFSNNLAKYIEMNHGGSNAYINNGGGGSIDFRQAGITKMRIKSNGNVGIGTTTPDNELEVNGTIRTKEVIVEATGWPDYVFYNDYDLPTLEEEEKHIEAEGHLLGFESEKDMAGEIQLGDVTERQQVKIEEIMLHLIEIKKEALESKNEIAELKEENKQLREQINKK